MSDKTVFDYRIPPPDPRSFRPRLGWWSIALPAALTEITLLLSTVTLNLLCFIVDVPITIFAVSWAWRSSATLARWFCVSTDRVPDIARINDNRSVRRARSAIFLIELLLVFAAWPACGTILGLIGYQVYAI